MKYKVILVVMLFLAGLLISSCASKKHRYNQCPTFGNKIENDNKQHNVG